LLVGDRNFASRALALQLANNPAALLSSFFPPFGATVNIANSAGSWNSDFTQFTPDPLVLDANYGGATLSAGFTHIPYGYAGVASDNAAALAANDGRYNLDLPNDLYGRR